VSKIIVLLKWVESNGLNSYINALGIGELLPRSSDFFGSEAISPYHTTIKDFLEITINPTY
jgi:hypothetical protein